MGKLRVKYGHEWADDMDDLHIELTCFRCKLTPEDGGLGRLGHYREISKLLWPDHVLTEWSDIMQTEFCADSIHPGQPRSTVVTGPGSASKSTEAAKFAVTWQAMAPLYSAIPVTSTSVMMARKRIWAEIKNMWQVADYNCKQRFGYNMPGNVLDSSCEIQAVKGDSKHAIAIVPGSQEFLSKGVKKLQGWHAEYVLVIADELQDMTEEVIEACVNMASGTKEFNFIGLGNGQSWFNTLGKTMMPKSGNPEDVNVEMDRWDTKDGVCIHLDGLRSPNIVEINPSTGQAGGKFPWLVSQDQIDKVVRKFGEDSLQYWQMIRGFPPPDGSINSVISESLLLKFGCLRDEELMRGWQWYAGLDPAFGGDNCVLKFAKVGTFADNSRMGIVFADKVIVNPKASLNEPLDYQIAHQVIAHCKERGMKSCNFSGDGTAIGRGVLAIIGKEWGMDVHKVEFGGGASDLPISDVDAQKGKDAYHNKSAELWFSFRLFATSNQIRGVSKEMARGFGARTYDTRGGRIMIQTKSEVKVQLGRSPDEEDAAVTIVDNLRHQGFFAGPFGFDQGWDAAVRKAAELEAGYAATDALLID